MSAAILKGQGVATLYGELSPYRQSGDIDIWVKGGYHKVCDYVQCTYPTDDLAYHRFHYHYFKDIEVELHHRPTLMRNLFDDRKLAKWYNSFDANSFVYLEDKGFAIPPIEFNRIFILTHIYRHFLFEGIGLRQVMDYYYVLKANKGAGREEMSKLLNKLRSGNFGRGDNRFNYKYLSTFRRMSVHGAHLMLHYPSEVIWTPIWLIYHKVWKWNKKREIYIGKNILSFFL